MNDQDRAELAELKLRQMRLGQELRAIAGQLHELERRLETQKDPVSAVVSEPFPAVSPSSPAPITPRAQPPPLPPMLQTAAAEAPRAEVPPLLAPKPEPTAPVPPVFQELEPPKAGSGGSLELRLGTYWAPRIGIVVLLTGLVFLGNLAYQSLGKTGKVLLLYMASGLLLAPGWWWQRRATNHTLRNYAQVLFAGGLAALYFTTYAAHHLESLRVITNPILDGLLLLGCAGLIVWTADRWKSEVLALFGAGLAYYSCIITRVGTFTLYSNLLLAAAAVFFLVRNRWANLSFGSVVASFGAYAFWRFVHGSEWHWTTPAQGLWSGTYFLICYWAVFTAGVFLPKHEKFAGQNRAAFLTLNNSAFFTCAVLTLLQTGHSNIFWAFSLIFGAALLLLSEFSRVMLVSEPLTRDFYLSQGLLLVTVGLIAKFSGLNLGLILAAQSVVLLLTGQVRKNLVLLTGAYVTAALAVGWAIDGMRQNEPAGIYLAIGIGALMLVNMLLVHRGSPQTDGPPLRADRSFFAVLALTTWLVATYNNTAAVHFPWVLAAEGLVLTFSIYLFRVRELTFLSQGLVLIGQAAWILFWTEHADQVPWWNPFILLSVSLAISHWWQWQKQIALVGQSRIVWQEVYAVTLAAILGFWLPRHLTAPGWLVVSSLLAVGLTAYGAATRAWMISATAQIFLGISIVQFALQLWNGKPGWLQAATPALALLTLSGATVMWFRRHPDAKPSLRDPFLTWALAYRWIAIAVSLAWIGKYIPPQQQIWVHALVGLALFLLAGWKPSGEGLLASAVYAAVALVLFWFPSEERQIVYWANLCSLVALLAQQQIARRLHPRYPIETPVQTVVIVLGTLSIWRFCTAWVLEAASGFYLTASWSFLALIFFACGILLRERAYRWLGLGLLACTLGRIVIFDVWKLQTFYRILSFMALGIVLLVLGYIYSRYQEKIRQWL